MIRAIVFLIAWLLVYGGIGYLILYNKIALPSSSFRLPIFCGLCGGIGGVTYCFRAVYLNVCVHNSWDNKWLPWYLIRPLVSFIYGIVSYLFLKAGLIVLEAKQAQSPTYISYYALAFIAGLNVDRFMEKIEDIAQVTWGIKKSRMSSTDDNNA